MRGVGGEEGGLGRVNKRNSENMEGKRQQGHLSKEAAAPRVHAPVFRQSQRVI